VVRRYHPDYPPGARRDGIEGRVVLTVQVRSDGRVGSVRVSTSSGSALLDSAAISAVKRWSFAPELQDGEKVSTTLNVPFRFELK
jgi:protein TonB